MDIKYKFWTIILISFMLIACERNNMVIYKSGALSIDQLPQDKLDSLSAKKIFFGHQSVGYNLVDGLKEILHDMPNIKLNIKETKNLSDFNAPVFAHYLIGKNKDPISKIEDFRKIMENGVGDRVDIAFFKFCYVDIVEDTNIRNVFDYLIKTLTYLQQRYPKVIFACVTVPLRVTNTSIQSNIKRLLHWKVWGDDDNIKRNSFNRLLIERNIKNINIFDIARHQSVYPGGKEIYLKKHNNKYFSLRPDFTNDGGHLNDSGSRFIADKLLYFLANI